jgi:predicted ATPase/DNA-binding CsgD family transcriptional regulator
LTSSARPSRQHNLPVQLTSFVGRERDAAEVTRLLSTSRLVTLTGAGGIGKTRLAIEVASKSVTRFADGVWLAELAPLADGRLVAATVLASLGAREESNRPPLASLIDALESKRLLLVLDNCEHLASACAALVDQLLRAAPGLHVLATSRQVLAVPGEVGWHVPALSMPAPDRRWSPEELAHCEAVALFADRARAALPPFTLAEGNAADVARVCRRLDGVPLALELAAPWVKALSVGQIAERLDDGFALLTRANATAPPRQQALRATIDWSHRLLSDAERTLFRRLAVFAGGWTLDSAEAVCAFPANDGSAAAAGAALSPDQVLPILAQLIDKSLIEVAEHGGAARYRFLESIRQYAAEKLGASGEEPALVRRHRAWFADVVERAEAEWRGARQASWLAYLDAEHDNIRAALDRRGPDRDELDAALRVAGALWWFWLMRGHLREGRAHLAGLLALAPPSSSATRAKALSTAGRLALVQGDYQAARSQLEASLAIWRTLDRRDHVADALHDLGQAAHAAGDHTRARQLLDESLGLANVLGDEIRVYLALDHLGELLQDLGDDDGAAAHYEQALAIQRGLGHRRGMVVSLTNLGSLIQRRGDHVRAEALYRESLTLVIELGDRRRTAACLEGLAVAAGTRGAAERAARLFGAADGLREAAGVTLPPPHRAAHDARVGAARATLRPEVFASAWAAGRAMSLDQAVRYALRDADPDDAGAQGDAGVAGDPPAAHAADPARRSARARGAPLTPREREVAALVARGLTNRQVAEALVITEGTAGSHVEHILAKLGFRTRAQIAAWAVAQNLLPSGPK